MEASELWNQLNDVFREVFDDQSIQIRPETAATDVDNWDSLNHISLMSAVEKHFKIKFTVREMSNLANVGDFVQLIRKKLL